MYKDKYERWFQHPNLDATLKEEMSHMSDTQQQDAFGTDITFGTAGMRGLLGAGSNRINVHTIRKATLGYIQYLLKYEKEKVKNGVAIGFDNRHMSKEFALDCAKLFSCFEIPTYCYSTLHATPQLSYAVRYYNCVGGIMITASHNPKEYNGYKLYDETGCQLIPTVAAKVIAEVEAIEDYISIDNATYQETYMHTIEDTIDEAYYKDVLSIQFHKASELEPIVVAFSAEHGTAHVPVNNVLKAAGYQLEEVAAQATPDPDFSSTLTPNPEDPKAYVEVIDLAKEKQADIVLVCDPDADRMGVGVKDGEEYTLLTGNQSGALLAYYIFSQYKLQNTMPQNPVMFNTVVTCDLGEDVATHFGVETKKTLTGFKYIGSLIETYMHTKEKTYVFGYEESYGSLIAPFVRDKDAPQACLMLAEACAYYKTQGKSLLDVLEEMYELFGHYYDTQMSISLEGPTGPKKLQELMEGLRKNQPETLGDMRVVRTEDYDKKVAYENGQEESFDHYDQTNILKYHLEDGSFIAVRPSGTEPKCKIYFSVHATSKEECIAQYEKYVEDMKKRMNV